MLIMVLAITLDACNKSAHIPERPSTVRLLRNQAEPAFNLTQPTRKGRRNVHVVARVRGQPRPDLRMPVRRLVVDDQMRI
ncbi:hypothetical protein [Caballeronia sp. INDeC2]|uniref:hypothetical protein n=1 Tax=Caballeronia sp. INDeC2 TaxID=2921747 RepID=UPI00202807AE|nr:hypothetical protein [Caballeronia sp. INDeC2]